MCLHRSVPTLQCVFGLGNPDILEAIRSMLDADLPVVFGSDDPLFFHQARDLQTICNGPRHFWGQFSKVRTKHQVLSLHIFLPIGFAMLVFLSLRKLLRGACNQDFGCLICNLLASGTSNALLLIKLHTGSLGTSEN